MVCPNKPKDVLFQAFQEVVRLLLQLHPLQQYYWEKATLGKKIKEESVAHGTLKLLWQLACTHSQQSSAHATRIRIKLFQISH